MTIRGIRGATTVEADDSEAILLATRELLQEIVTGNSGLKSEEISSAFFTLTRDLTSAYPAQAARQIGWGAVPMLCSQEIPVPGSVPRVIRVLIHWDTDVPQSAIRHVYLRQATGLRPDLCDPGHTVLTGLEESES